MTIYQVQGPDGRIHEIEGPAGASPSDIESFVAKNVQTDKSKYETSGLKSYAAGLMHGVPMATDAASMVAGVYGMTKGVPFSEGKDAARSYFKEQQKMGQEKFPAASMTGNILGSMAVVPLIPANALKGTSVLMRAMKGAGVAGGMGAAYGFGEGDGLQNRIGEAITQGAVSAPFGFGASLATDAIGLAARKGYQPLKDYGGNLLARTKSAIGGRNEIGAATQNNTMQFGETGNNVLAAIKAPGEQAVDMTLAKGKALPLTVGQMTQNPKNQALEWGAAAGNYGDDARALALEARDLQTDAAKSALQKVSGAITEDTPFTAARDIQAALKDSYQKARAQTNAAYNKVGEMTQDSPLKIGAQYVKETVIPSFKDWARKGENGLPFDLNGRDMGEAKRLYEQATGLKMDKLNAVNFSRMEQWRGRVAQAIRGSQNPAEKKFLGGMIERFDTSMSQLPKEAIKSGDVRLIEELEKARGARAYQGATFERNDFIAGLLQDERITNEELANVLFSVKSRTNKADAGLALKDVIAAVGDKGGEVLDAAKRGNYAKILRNSLSNEIKPGGEQMISFDKLATNLKSLVEDNKTLFKTLHPDPAEQEFVKNLLSDVRAIKSAKPGSRNYSNTAYTLLNWLKEMSPTATATTIPFVGSLGGGLQRVGNESAALEVQKSLSPVFKQTIDDLNGPLYNFFDKYGKRSAVSAAAVTSAPLKITVRPSDDPHMKPQIELPEVGR